MKYQILNSIFAFFLPIFLLAEDPNIPVSEEYIIKAAFTTEEIKIDGQLNESTWTSAEEVSDFWLSFPTDDRHADEKHKTIVKVAYNESTFYISAICHGGDSFIMPTLKRDSREFWSGDVFGVVLDPVNEKTNGFIFATNTAGVQLESLISGMARRNSNGGSINGAWDQSWEVETQVFDNYWTVEMAIPFKSIRYGEKENWGINFWRGISENNEWHSWTKMSVEFMVVDLGGTGTLAWEKAPEKSKNNISVVPYVLGSTTKDFDGNEPSKQTARIGGDAKIALSTSMNLDLTINPDFSQVDVDEQVTNLTTVNIRFPERRLFFLENSDLFTDFGIPPIRPFFSRRIGLDENGAPIPIAYGARVSGNVNKDLRVGAMNLQTRLTDEFDAQNYTSLAVHQQVKGRSVVKGYFHNRNATTSDVNTSTEYNRVAGLEGQYISPNNRFRTAAGGGKSWTPELEGDDLFYMFLIGYNDRKWSLYTNLSGMGDNYRSDMGFNPRFNHYDAVQDTTFKLGYHHWFSRATYTILPQDKSVFNFHNIGVRNIADYTQEGLELINNRTFLFYEAQWANTSSVQVTFAHEEQGLLFPFKFTDEPLPVGIYKYNHVQIGYDSDNRKAFAYGLSYRNGGFYNGDRQE